MSQTGDQFYLGPNQSVQCGEGPPSDGPTGNSAQWGNFGGHMDISMETLVVKFKKDCL